MKNELTIILSIKEKTNVNIEEIKKGNYAEILKIESLFKIIINYNLFFNDEYFPVLEFLKFINEWDFRQNFNYNCIETEDNPLISFINENDKWFIKSPWQLFDCKTSFTREELEKAVIDLKEDVEKQLKY
ncbi:MAG: hypothetical protein FWC53_02745 [Firmicutes bacterium]|nr:hypothetical protein [Bacillota bacterium]